MLSDLKFAFRSLAKTPGFTLIAVLTIAVGIGATTTVFSWIERILLHPLPGVREESRIVALETVTPSGEHIDTSYPDYLDYRDRSHLLSDLVVDKARPLNFGNRDRPERVWSEMVSGNFFSALGVHPLLGRFFAPEDRADEPAAKPVAVIGENFWRQHLDADPKILGQTIYLNQHAFIVVGVASAGFRGSLNGLVFDVWIPLQLQQLVVGEGNWLASRSSRPLHILGRLAPDVTLEAARAELTGIAAQLAAAHPDSNRGLGVALLPLMKSKDGAQHELALPLLFLLGVCALVYLIVCANLSNLLFVRASARQREICIRQALGAGRFRLVRQLLVEGLVLSAGGLAVGAIMTLWTADLLRALLPSTDLPVVLSGQLDLRVLAGAALLSVGTTLVSGLAPASWGARTDPLGVLRSGRSGMVSPGAEKVRGLLVAAEVAIAVVTLTCAGLAAKSFVAAGRADPGFRASGVLLATLKPGASGYDRDRGLALLDRVQTELAKLPGVESVALSDKVPLGLDAGSWEDVSVPGYVPAVNENMKIYRNPVSPGYFQLMRIPVQSGREFRTSDDAGARTPPVAIVNETFARRFFGTTNAVDRAFSMWGGTRTLRVVGVVPDIKYHRINENAQPYFYLPLAQSYNAGTGIALHVRVRQGDPLALLPAVRRELHLLAPDVPVFEAFTLEDYISSARFAQKLAAEFLGLLSVIAVALAALGLYGVLAFVVAQRTAEIGVRMALGARPADIFRLVLRRGFRLVAVGLGAGLLIALGVARFLSHLLYGVHGAEPALQAAVALLIAVAAFFACWLPARRATKVDPMVALRAE